MVMTCSYLPYCLADQSSSGCFTSVLRRLCTVGLSRYTISSSGWLSERPKELVLKTRGRQPRPGGSNPPPSAKVMSRDIVPLMSRDMTFLITRRLKPGPSFLLYTNPDPSFQANHLPTTSALPARYSRLNRAPTESFLLNNSYKMLEFGSR